jgi:hypothetical protein
MKTLKMFNFYYHKNGEVVEGVYENAFLEAHQTIQLDCLQDAIHELQELYGLMTDHDESASASLFRIKGSKQFLYRAVTNKALESAQ